MAYSYVLKKTIEQIFDLRKSFKCLLFVIIPALLFYVCSLAILTAIGFTTKQVLRDPAQLTKTPSLLGFLTIVGAWLWVSSFTICFFTLFSRDFSGEVERRRLLFFSGVFALLLAIDDVFLLHDRYIHAWALYGVYAACAVFLLIRFRVTIFKIEGFGFLAAGFFLFLSILTDFFQYKLSIHYDLLQLIEEGFKFVGIASWLYFNGRIASYNAIVDSVRSEEKKPAHGNSYFKNDIEVSKLNN